MPTTSCLPATQPTMCSWLLVVVLIGQWGTKMHDDTWWCLLVWRRPDVGLLTPDWVAVIQRVRTHVPSNFVAFGWICCLRKTDAPAASKLRRVSRRLCFPSTTTMLVLFEGGHTVKTNGSSDDRETTNCPLTWKLVAFGSRSRYLLLQYNPTESAGLVHQTRTPRPRCLVAYALL